MPTTTKPTVKVERFCNISVTVSLSDDQNIRNWLFFTKEVAGYVIRDYREADGKITVIYFVAGNKEQDFYKAVEEWCQEKGYLAQLPEPTQ